MFGKAAVWQGALDKFAEAKAGKRGTAEVDDEFLAEIERWRELLARNLVLRNPALRGRDVNWAVQQIIDRIVFLRICEARDLETFEQLRALLNGGHTYERLQELFRRADLRYNSGLFHFEVEKDRARRPTPSPRAWTSTTRRSRTSSSTCTTRRAPTSSRCSPPTSWATSTSGSWAR